MKNLTHKELKDAPSEVQYLYMCSVMNHPIGSSIYEETIKKHPEYFPDEIEHRKKWEAIPKEVHDAYWKEYWKIDKEIYKDVPHRGKGILFYAQNPKEYAEYKEAFDAARKKALPLHEALHRKFYSKYGIEWHGI